MTELEAEAFVAKFAASWAEEDGAAMMRLWHPDGWMHAPWYDRAVRGDEVAALRALLRAGNPRLVWSLLDWTWRGDVVVIEWESSLPAGEELLRWRGVDKLTLRGGRIAEEIVYSDPSPLLALRSGRAAEALVPLPPTFV
jgi:hypothetical protein